MPVATELWCPELGGQGRWPISRSWSACDAIDAHHEAPEFRELHDISRLYLASGVNVSVRSLACRRGRSNRERLG
jgi:hypothetical protein